MSAAREELFLCLCPPTLSCFSMSHGPPSELSGALCHLSIPSICPICPSICPSPSTCLIYLSIPPPFIPNHLSIPINLSIPSTCSSPSTFHPHPPVHLPPATILVHLAISSTWPSSLTWSFLSTYPSLYSWSWSPHTGQLDLL